MIFIPGSNFPLYRPVAYWPRSKWLVFFFGKTTCHFVASISLSPSSKLELSVISYGSHGDKCIQKVLRQILHDQFLISRSSASLWINFVSQVDECISCCGYARLMGSWPCMVIPMQKCNVYICTQKSTSMTFAYVMAYLLVLWVSISFRRWSN